MRLADGPQAWLARLGEGGQGFCENYGWWGREPPACPPPPNSPDLLHGPLAIYSLFSLVVNS